MIKLMKHFEAHLIENSHDLQLADSAGLDVYDDDQCENCYLPVGDTRTAGKFKAFIIFLDENSEWIICKDCSENIL
jgi:hypothetical protein